MNINLFINEKKLSFDAESAIKEYIKRISPYANMKIFTAEAVLTFDSSKNTKNFLIKPASISEYGCSTISSPDFAMLINKMALNGISRINYYIGYKKNELKIAFIEDFAISTMNLSTTILAQALAEQIYRAYTINNNITYHK